MKLAARLVATAGLAVTACVFFPPAAPPVRSRDAPDPFVGCWQLQVGPYKPHLNLQGDEQFIVVPSALQLVPNPGTKGWQTEGLALAALSGERESFLRTGYWYPVGPSKVFARLTDGFTSLKFTFVLRAGRLHGTVRPGWDFSRRSQSASVEATSQPCPPAPP